MFRKLSTLILLLSVSIGVSAQMTPQQQQQLPPSDPSSSQYNSVYLPSIGQGDTIRPAKWADRWGAFASSPSDGWSGSALNRKSKREAEKSALNECKGKGSSDCRVNMSFSNQCGAVASGGNGFGYARAPKLEIAVSDAMSECGSAECEIFFEGCSLPEQVQ